MTAAPAPPTLATPEAQAAPETPSRPLASAIVVSWSSRRHLDRCLRSLLAQTYRPLEVLLVDNDSPDGSAAYVEATFPTVRVIQTGANLGYGGGNNRGFAEARGDILVVVNPDTEAAPAFVEELVNTLDRQPQAGLVTAKIVYFDDRTTINTCGTDVHVSGVSYCKNLGRRADVCDADEEVAAISGCGFAARRSVIEEIGGFIEELFLYVEDTDLSLRARSAGYEVWHAAGALLYHKYDVKMAPRKFFYLERNRWLMLLWNFRWATLAALGPGLAIAEGMAWAYAGLCGPRYLLAKAQSYDWLLAHRAFIRRQRAAIQRRRRVGDDALLARFTAQLPADQLLGSSAVAAAAGELLRYPFVLSLGLARRAAARPARRRR